MLLWDLADSVASLTAAAPEGAGRKGQHKEVPRLMGGLGRPTESGAGGTIIESPRLFFVLRWLLDIWSLRRNCSTLCCSYTHVRPVGAHGTLLCLEFGPQAAFTPPTLAQPHC